MKRRIIAFLVLFVLASAAGLGLHIWTQRGMILLGDPSWPGLRLASLSRIDVKSAAGTYSFAPEKGVWHVRTPDGHPVLADAAKVQTLLDTIARRPPLDHVARYTRREKSQYGLDNDDTSITLLGNEIWGIVLGADGPGQGTVYARSSLQGDQVHLLDASYRELIVRPVEYYHDLRLVGADSPDAVTRVSAEGPGTGVWEVVRGKSEGFAFTAPEKHRPHAVAQPKLEMYLHTLVNARGRALADNATETPPHPQLRLSVWTRRSDTPETVDIFHDGNGGKTFIARLSRQGTPVLIDGELAQKLAVTAFALRARPVLGADPGQADEQIFTVLTGSGTRIHTAVRDRNGWLDRDSGRELTGFDVILWRLGAIQFVDTPRTTAPEGAQHVLTWTLRTAAAEPIATVEFYTDPAASGRCWLHVQGEEYWFPVERLLLNDLLSRLPAR